MAVLTELENLARGQASLARHLQERPLLLL